MKQSRKASFVESMVNIAVGYGIQCLGFFLIMPVIGYRVTVSETLVTGVFFTFISLARSFFLRRVFEELRVRGIMP